jgi:hypothetical protein
MEDHPDRGAQRRLSLTFLDQGLEESYQLAAGQESLNGFRAVAVAHRPGPSIVRHTLRKTIEGGHR